MLYNIVWYGVMPNRTTYYSSDEMDRIEELAEQRDTSFSAIVRGAVREVYDV